MKRSLLFVTLLLGLLLTGCAAGEEPGLLITATEETVDRMEVSAGGIGEYVSITDEEDLRIIMRYLLGLELCDPEQAIQFNYENTCPSYVRLHTKSGGTETISFNWIQDEEHMWAGWFIDNGTWTWKCYQEDLLQRLGELAGLEKEWLW